MSQPPNYQQPVSYQSPDAGKPKGMAITSMVLGICAFVPGCCLSWLSFIVAPILAILAIIFGTVSLKAAKRGEAGGTGMAKAGLILGIINLALMVVLIILAAVGVSVWGSDLMEEIERQQQMQTEETYDDGGDLDVN